MAEKKKRATDQLNVALSGIDSALAVAMDTAADERTKQLLRKAQDYCEQARGYLEVIKANLNAL